MSLIKRGIDPNKSFVFRGGDIAAIVLGVSIFAVLLFLIVRKWLAAGTYRR